MYCYFAVSPMDYAQIDVYNLKRSDVKNGHIEVITIKTGDSLIIELNDHSKAILEKIQKCYRSLMTKALPVVSNQRMNEFLKRTGTTGGNR